MIKLLLASVLAIVALIGVTPTADAQGGSPKRITLTRAQVFARLKPMGFRFDGETTFGNGKLASGGLTDADDTELGSVSVTTLNGQIESIDITYNTDIANLESQANAILENFKTASRILFPKWVGVPDLLDAEFGRVIAAARNGDESEIIQTPTANVMAFVLTDLVGDDVEVSLVFQDQSVRKRFVYPNAPGTVTESQGLVSAAPTPAPTAQPKRDPAPAQPAAPTTGAGVAPIDAWNCPSSHPFKGNRNSMIYHPPGGRYYNRTKPEECFATADDAVAAGYRAPKR